MKLEEFIQRFSKHGDRIAVISEGIKRTYSELETACCFIASYSMGDSISNELIDSTYLISYKDSFSKIVAILGRLLGNRSILLLEDGNTSAIELVYSKGNKIHPVMPQMLLLTSGTSGKPKIAVHNAEKFLEKYVKIKNPYITLQFLPLDHIGGLDVMFSTLSNGGTLVIPRDRNVATVLKTIEEYKVEVFPTTPSFLNLLLISGEYENYDLSSLQVIAYGAETMPEATLKELHKILPKVKLKQTYGSTELGTLKTYSKSSDSLYIKIVDNIKVIDNILYVKSDSSMLGYLGEETVFDEEGWYCTGDLVEQDGGYLKILGRASSLINVGGNKVSPEQVENIIHSFQGIKACLVYGEENPLLGSIVSADIEINAELQKEEFIKLLREHCLKYLPKYAIPITFNIQNKLEMTERFKKKRGNH